MTMQVIAKLYPLNPCEVEKSKEALEHFRGVLEAMGASPANIPVIVTTEPYPAEWNNPGARDVVKIDGHIHFNDGTTFYFGFGAALTALKAGQKVSRAGWNGKGMFLYHVPANIYPAQTDAAKAAFGDMVPYGAYIAMKTAQGNVVPWLASQTDMLADDWMIVQ